MTTEYVVLKQDEQTDAWKIKGHGTGPTARDVVSACADDEGVYVAVPRRSWKPAGLKIETVKRKVWDDNGDTPPTKESD